MVTWLRRMFWLALLGGGAYGGWAWWQRSRADGRPPEWPPLDTATGDTSTDAGTDTARIAAAVPSASSGDDTEPEAGGDDDGDDDDAGDGNGSSAPERWRAPVDGECPDGFPIKANDNSGIYHQPGGRSYDRTVPERCYASAADAEADGYRAAKA